MDNVFYDGDGRTLHCAVNLDEDANNSRASIDTALDRAARTGEVVELYAHSPGKAVSLDKLEYTLAGAASRGLRWVTYGEFARGEGTGPGIALSIDDAAVDLWTAARPLFDRYGAKVTFFVTRYYRLNEDRKAQLRALHDDGHEMQAHTSNHLRGPEYVEDHGLRAYMEDEIIPSIELMRADGYDITALAYPFGARTREIDKAVLAHVSTLRSVAFSWSGPVMDGCP